MLTQRQKATQEWLFEHSQGDVTEDLAFDCLYFCIFLINYLYLIASHGIISAPNKMDSKAGEDDSESCRRVCLICGNTEKELSMYVLRAPEHLNGWIQHQLASIHSSLLISNDQEGEKNVKFFLIPKYCSLRLYKKL